MPWLNGLEIRNGSRLPCQNRTAEALASAYRKTGVGGSDSHTRRGIGRTMTDDFHRFPLPEEIFWPDATQAPHDTWYASGKTVMPGAPDYHLMFPLRWHLPTDRFEFHLASSPDNIVWGFCDENIVWGFSDTVEGTSVLTGEGL